MTQIKEDNEVNVKLNKINYDDDNVKLRGEDSSSNRDSSDVYISAKKKDVSKFVGLSKKDLKTAGQSDVDMNNIAYQKYLEWGGTLIKASDNVDEMVNDLRRLLKADLINEDWGAYSHCLHKLIASFTVANGIDLKYKYNYKLFYSVEKELVKIPISVEIIKDPKMQRKDRSYKNLINFIFKGVDLRRSNLKFPQYKDEDEFINDKKYKMFLPAFRIVKGCSKRLLDRVYFELNQFFRFDPKLALFLQYVSFENFTELRSVRWFGVYFDICGFDPFKRNRDQSIDRKHGMINSCSAIWMTCLLNMIQIEQARFNLLKKYELFDLFDEILALVFTDNPCVAFEGFSKITNNVLTLFMCYARSVEIPMYNADTNIMASNFSSTNNLFNYKKIYSDTIKMCKKKNVPTMIKLIDVLTVGYTKDAVDLLAMARSFNFISGYTGSEVFESVYRQIYAANDKLNKIYNFEESFSSEMNKQFKDDWDNPALKNYQHLKQEFFDKGYSVRGYTPKDFNYGDTQYYKDYCNAVTYAVTEINSNINQGNFLQKHVLEKKVLGFQTSRGSGIKISIKMAYDPISIAEKKNKKLKTISYKSSNYRNDTFMQVTNKRGVSLFLGVKYLLDIEQAIVKNIVTGGYRGVPGVKPLRQIFNDSIQAFSLLNAMANELFKAMKKMSMFYKSNGSFPDGHFMQQRASSVDGVISLYGDFSVFDGSGKSGIQKPMYDYWRVAWDAIFDLETNLTYGELVYMLQAPKYRQPLLIKFKDREEIHFIDMILSGELWTNNKDSIINWSLVFCGLVKLKDIMIDRVSFNHKEHVANGDDSFGTIDLNESVYNIVETVNKEGVKFKKVYFEQTFINDIDRWSMECKEMYDSLGFEFKAGYGYNENEYLKIVFKNGVAIPNMRLQRWTSEKRGSAANRLYTILTDKALSTTITERGYTPFIGDHITKLLALSGFKFNTDQFFVPNLVCLFSPVSFGGVGCPIKSNLCVFPNTTMLSSHVMLKTTTNLVSNNDILRFIRLYYKDEPIKAIANDVAREIISGNYSIVNSTVPDVQFQPKDYYSSRDPERIRQSINAYNELKDSGYNFPKGAAYFNGLESFLGSSITGTDYANATAVNRVENVNFNFLEGLKNGRNCDIMNITELVMKEVNFIRSDSYTLLDYSNTLNNVAIGSDLDVIMFKDLYGYAGIGSMSNFEADLMTEVRRVDNGAPNDLNNETLLNVLLKPEIINNLYWFRLHGRALGLSEAAILYLYDVLPQNFIYYSQIIRKENFSAVTPYFTMWDLSLNKLKDRFAQKGNLLTNIATIDQIILQFVLCMKLLLVNSITLIIQLKFTILVSHVT